MRLKYYLRGIGIGVIVTTLVLMAALMIHKSELLSDAEICDRAAELGMVMPEETVKPARDTLSSMESAEQEEAKQTKNAEEAAQTEKTAASDKDAANTKKDQKTDKKAKDTEEKEVEEQVELSIVGGEYSDIVSEKLRKAGLIEDAEDFNKYLAAGNYDNLIQPGTYLIPLGADYATIVKIITEKKDKK